MPILLLTGLLVLVNHGRYEVFREKMQLKLPACYFLPALGRFAISPSTFPRTTIRLSSSKTPIVGNHNPDASSSSSVPTTSAIEDPVEIAAGDLLIPPTSAKNAPEAMPSSIFGSPLSSHLSSRRQDQWQYDRGGFFPLGKQHKETERALQYILHIHASANNTILSLTDDKGRVLINESGGSAGFKKSNRGGFEAAYQATVKIAEKVRESGLDVKFLEMRFKGFGPGRNASFKAIRSVTDWEIVRVTDATPIPFNGCRSKKARRLLDFLSCHNSTSSPISLGKAIPDISMVQFIYEMLVTIIV